MGEQRKGLAPRTTASLLVWLIDNLPSTGARRPTGNRGFNRKRRELFDGIPAAIQEALSLLKGKAQKGARGTCLRG